MYSGPDKLALSSREYNLLCREKSEGRLFHSYIIESTDRLYLDAFVKRAVSLIMCKNGGCGQCDTCIKTAKGIHVDVFSFPQGGRKMISARDDIDTFRNAYSYKPLEGGSRVFVFDAESSVRDDWQNKMLKSLEEPLAGNYVIIRTDNLYKLLPTVRSRSRHIPLSPVSDKDMLSVLVGDGFDEFSARQAVSFACGSLTVAYSIITDEKSRGLTEFIFEMLLNCNSSKDCVRFVQGLSSAKENADMLFFLMSGIFHRILLAGTGKNQDNADIKRLSTVYNARACGEIISIISEASRKSEMNVNFTAITEDLLLKIMEVRYKCR